MKSRGLTVGFVTTAAPPSPNGQARVLGQIVTDDVAIPIFMTDQMNILESDQEHFGRHYKLSSPEFRLVNWSLGRFQGLNRAGGLARTAVTRAREVVTVLRRDPVDILVGCSGNPFDLSAACLAARRLGIPLIAYLFDDPVYQWEAGLYRHAARLAERLWSRSAQAIVVPNEVLAADIHQRLPKARIHIVRNPVDSTAFSAPLQPLAADPPTLLKPWRLLYSGSVYSAQADAFENLKAALEIQGGRFILELYSAQSSSDLVAKQLASPYFWAHPNVSHTSAMSLQHKADILFLPLAFSSPIPEVIRSSAPAKLGEYLAAGRPILVHAPAGSFVAEIIRKADAGVVVDVPDPCRLSEALHALSSDARLRERIVSNARKLARDFHVDRAKQSLSSIFEDLLRQ